MTINHAPVKGIVIAKIARTTAAVAKTILINTSTNRQHGGQAPVDVTCLESRDFEAAGSYSGLSRCLQTTTTTTTSLLFAHNIETADTL